MRNSTNFFVPQTQSEKLYLGLVMAALILGAAGRPFLQLFQYPPRDALLLFSIGVIACTSPLLVFAQVRWSFWSASAAVLVLLLLALGAPSGLRERFLWDAADLSDGMDRAEVKLRMQPYILFSTFEQGEADCEGYRHSTKGPDIYDSVIVCYRDDEVMRVDVSLD